MAKIRGRSGEGLSGLVGNVVFYNYSGEACVRSAPRKRPKNSWSEKQVLSRQRFIAIKAFWGRFDNSPIQGIWKMAEKGRRGDNLFVSINMPAFAPGGTLIDPERLHFSAGQLPLPYRFTASRSESDRNTVNVSWQDDPGSSLTRSDDTLMMMVGHEGEFTGPIVTGAMRKQESAVIQLPLVTGTVQGIYLFFASEKRKLYSGDQYFGL